MRRTTLSAASIQSVACANGISLALGVSVILRTDLPPTVPFPASTVVN